jgi:methionyl-tRNA synthetase
VKSAIYQWFRKYLGSEEWTEEILLIQRVFLHAKNQVLFKRILERSIEQYRFREALSEFMALARLGNKYLADEEPWKIIKTDEERVKTILNIGLQIASNLAILAQPFLPFSAQKLFTMLNMNVQDWNKAGTLDLLPIGHQLNEASLLFEKIEDAEIEAQIQRLMDSKKENEQASMKVEEAKANVSFEQFSSMDIRIGTILEAEKVAKTKKLLKLKIDTGIDQRTIVSGIAEYFEPEQIIGKQVSVLINLEPREIKGILSQGMILMAENPDGTLSFVAPESVFVNGSTVR